MPDHVPKDKKARARGRHYPPPWVILILTALILTLCFLHLSGAAAWSWAAVTWIMLFPGCKLLAISLQEAQEREDSQ